ncbi:MAG TPA: glycosyltransferase [Candidatus Binatia bacterium]|nr:glycosyltransferase [Candidatus Binatia bacterium]
MKIVVFGLSVTSTWGNGHGTTWRALLRALHERGHDITFFEKNVEWYASNRDLPKPAFCEVCLYEQWSKALFRVRQELKRADVAIVGSYFPDGISAIDEMLDADVPVKAFYDIDTPVTMTALRDRGATDYLAPRQIRPLDIYFSFTGGPLLAEIERRYGARRAVPLYCSVDPRQHRRFPPNSSFACDLSYLGTYAADRQPKLEELLCEPARQLRAKKFIVAGPQYPKTLRWPKNVRRIAHLSARWHPEFYSSSRLTLNVTRRDMAIAGYSPSVRLFEAAACGAAIVSDKWPGLETFFSPAKEILLPDAAADIVRYVSDLSDQEIRRIGEAAQARTLAEHTSDRRALQFEREVETALAMPQLAGSEAVAVQQTGN